MNKIYVVNGLPESGKSEFGKQVGLVLRERGINFLHTSSINYVKMLLKPETEWDEVLSSQSLITGLRSLKNEVTPLFWDGQTKDDFWRKAMSDLKLKIIDYHPTLLHGLVLDEIYKLPDPRVAFVDAREPEYIRGFQEHAIQTRRDIQVETIFVNSDRSKIAYNFSDMSVNNMRYDIVIENLRNPFYEDNYALWFLKARAKAFVEQEILEGRTRERIY